MSSVSLLPRHLVFDLDGTLVDSVGICAHIIGEMIENRGGTPSDGLVALTRRFVSVGGSAMVQAVLGDSKQDPDADIAEFRERYLELLTPEGSLFPGVRETLKRLSARGHVLSICSNKPQHLCEKVLGELQITEYFEAVVGTQKGSPHKPDPAHLDRTLRLVGGERVECHYIGDSEVDLALSVRAGVPFVCVSYGYGDFDGVVESFQSVDAFSELLELYPEPASH
jgi:phosphoglycolate phosphatase